MCYFFLGVLMGDRRMWCTSGALILGVILKAGRFADFSRIFETKFDSWLMLKGETPSPVLTLQRKRISQAISAALIQKDSSSAIIFLGQKLWFFVADIPLQISVGKEHAVALTEGGRVFVSWFQGMPYVFLHKAWHVTLWPFVLRLGERMTLVSLELVMRTVILMSNHCVMKLNTRS